MKNTRTVFRLAVVMVIGFAIVLLFASCMEEEEDDYEGYIDPTAFRSAAELAKWLTAQPDNTPDTPYTVKLNGGTGGGISQYEIALNDAGRYVNIVLSGKTLTSFGISSTMLIEITIPECITYIGGFSGCTNLTAINVASGNSAYSSRDGILYNKNKTILHAYPAGKASSAIIIPDGVTSIGSYAFSGCTSLTSITIPDSVTSIGFDAFSQTPWLNNQPDGLVYAGKVAYLYKGTMPANTSITLLDGTKEIAGKAFRNCTNLSSITIPNSVISIGFEAFRNCTSLSNITIPNSVTSIGGYAFFDCTKLTRVTFEGTNTKVDYSFPGNFYDVYNKRGTYTTTAPMNNNSRWKKIS